MSQRLIIGYLGPRCHAGMRKRWNAVLAGEGRDGFFDSYPTNDRAGLQLRLSEMFLLERRGYVIGEGLAGEALTLMDVIEESAKREGRVNVVVNRGGVLHGFFVDRAEDASESLRLFLGP